MPHTAEIIHNPEKFALNIEHREGHIQHELRTRFTEQHRIEAVGANAVAFSVICCGDPNTAERHTVHLPDETTPDEMRAIMEFHATQHARRHASATSALKIVADIAEKGVECKNCK